MHNIVLDLVHLRGSHTADNLRKALLCTLEKYGIGPSQSCVTCDNAAVMPAVCRVLDQSLRGWKKKDNPVLCMAHIINLAAQKILKNLKGQPVEDEEAADLVAIQRVEDGVYPEAVLRKVRYIMAKLRASPSFSEALEKEAQVVGLKFPKPVMDMRVRYAI